MDLSVFFELRVRLFSRIFWRELVVKAEKVILGGLSVEIQIWNVHAPDVCERLGIPC